MKVPGGIQCLKYLMIIFSVIFAFAGTALLSIGLWLRFDPKTKDLFEGPDSTHVFYTVVYMLIGVGAVIMAVGFLGCCGAIRESPCMLGTFFALLLVLFAIQVAAGIWGFYNQSKVVDDITTFYVQTYNNYKTTGEEALRETLRLIQSGLNCCGPTGNADAAKDTCPQGELLEELMTKSCPDAIEEVFDSKLHIVGGVGIAVGIIMVTVVCFHLIRPVMTSYNRYALGP
ncbi:CD9 molecule a isoform X2 [Cynoglossus semilaevis]|uniref:CD9 molecule a isoform X2 n=1 Tax=Cynoglossus semilaevis TaxID=244447 RepID=UPI000D62EF0D|nr:CD9 antigen-like isoform X2 [Cynoglossus semilaevis]